MFLFQKGSATKISSFKLKKNTLNQLNKKPFHWAVVGAGPAGIAAVGKLLDNGIHPQHILWLDPHFKVGDLGQLWRHVSSNTTVKRFVDFLHAVDSFNYKHATIDFQLNRIEPENTCTLLEVVKPLQWVSDHLTPKVVAQQTTVHSMALSERTWSLNTDTQIFKAKNVILATGAVPSSLNYPGVDVIPFDIAIDKDRLAATVNTNETYAVFGSSHSAIIIVRYLVELGVKKLLTFTVLLVVMRSIWVIGSYLIIPGLRDKQPPGPGRISMVFYLPILCDTTPVNLTLHAIFLNATKSSMLLGLKNAKILSLVIMKILIIIHMWAS